jgi:hypothetical protein
MVSSTEQVENLMSPKLWFYQEKSTKWELQESRPGRYSIGEFAVLELGEGSGAHKTILHMEWKNCWRWL